MPPVGAENHIKESISEGTDQDQIPQYTVARFVGLRSASDASKLNDDENQRSLGSER